MKCPLPVSADHEGKASLSASSNFSLSLYRLLAISSLRIPWEEPLFRAFTSNAQNFAH
jgi:hypothetical protein